jgi:hypothetical protein
VEAGLRFYQRLAHADPVHTMRLFDEPAMPVEAYERRYEFNQLKAAF